MRWEQEVEGSSSPMLEFTHTTLRSCKPPPHDAEHYSEGGGRGEGGKGRGGEY